MALLTAADGGKYVAGYGKFDNWTTFGWVIKLWGTAGPLTKCSPAYMVPTGH